MIDKRLLKLLGEDKKYVVFMVICNLISTILNIIMTFSICFVFHCLITQTGTKTMMIPFVVAVCAALGKFLLYIGNGFLTARLGTGVKTMLRRRIYEKAAKLGVRETDEISLAALTQVGIEGVEQLDLYYSTYVPQLFSSVLSPVILFLLLMFICKPAAVILICCVPLIPMSIIAVSRYAGKIFGNYWGKYTRMGDAFLDNLSGMQELKIYRADRNYHEKMNDSAEEFRKITMKVLTMQLASTTIMDLVAYGGAGLGIGIAVANHMNIHPIVSMATPALVLLIVLVAVDFFLPLRALGAAFHVSMNGATSGKKILTFLDTPEPVWGSEKVDSYDIKIKDVEFSYVDHRRILDGISMEIHPGELVGIVGMSGSGKSTIAALLSGFRQYQKGEILIGGKELHSLSRDDYFLHMGLLSSNTHLFSDTVRNNFRMAKADISDEEIAERLQRVKLSGVVTADTFLSEEATNLSGGQRQRLAFAVHLAADKDIYLFDEITSGIDADSEAIIMENIVNLAKTKTVIMISHRLRNFKNADRIYVVENGKLVAQGSHDQLCSQEGLYKELYETQTGMEEGYLS